MLTEEEFNALSDYEKATIVLKGKFVADRKENKLMIQLFSMGGFYVELLCDPFTKGSLRFRSFKSCEILIPYLNNVRLDFRG